MFARKIENSAN
jgi:hypothetical protein